MTDKPSAIEELMVRAALETCIGNGELFDVWVEDFARSPELGITEIVQSILAALDTSGLKVVPEEATDRMILLENTGGYHAAWRRVLWRDMHSAFDPTTWTPEDGQ